VGFWVKRFWVNGFSFGLVRRVLHFSQELPQVFLYILDHELGCLLVLELWQVYGYFDFVLSLCLCFRLFRVPKVPLLFFH
jgi:hypothetical protein